MLNSLSKATHDILPAKDRASWRSYYRRECLDGLLSWPAEVERDSFDTLPDEMDAASLVQVQRRFPLDDIWDRYQAVLDEGIRDLISVRGDDVPPQSETVMDAVLESGVTGTCDDDVPDQSVTGAAEPDGPAGFFSWRFGGVTLAERMEPKPWNLCDFLWKSKDRTADFDDLAKLVYEDHKENVTSDRVGSTRKKANAYFEKHGIPWNVRTSGRKVTLESKDRHGTDESAPPTGPSD